MDASLSSATMESVPLEVGIHHVLEEEVKDNQIFHGDDSPGSSASRVPHLSERVALIAVTDRAILSLLRFKSH